MHAVRPGLPGQGGGPRPGPRENWSSKSARSSWPRVLRSTIPGNIGLPLCQFSRRGDQHGVRAHPVAPRDPLPATSIRPSDHKEPQKIAWLQCVGSRDLNHCDNSYCSSVCCMYAIKQAVIAKEHAKTYTLDASIFFMDMRTHGKDFEKYYWRAQDEHGVRFLRSRIHTIDPIPGTDDVLMRYLAENGEIKDRRLRHGGPLRGSGVLPGCPETGQDPGRRRRSRDPLRQDLAVHPGVHQPRRASTSAASSRAPRTSPSRSWRPPPPRPRPANSWRAARGTALKKPELPPERDVSGEEPRIGVFVCNCGINIGGVIDVPGPGGIRRHPAQRGPGRRESLHLLRRHPGQDP